MEELLKAMRELLSNAFAQMRAENNNARIVPPQPAVVQAAKPKPAVKPAQQPAPQIVVNTDPDGFNSPAE